MTLNELVPTYGNWGGPGWSAGERTAAGVEPNWDSGLYGTLYAPLAELAFGAKSLYDLAQIALAQLEQLDANNGQYDPFPDNHTTIPLDMNGLFNSAQGWMPPRGGDPLVLDLDRDGIETLQINTNSPILFDHDGDGIKTATGWVKSDDALLVLDISFIKPISNNSLYKANIKKMA